MTDFLNLRIQKGEEAAMIEFDSQGKSLSVYGVSVTKIIVYLLGNGNHG